jgi:hypothetical protein
MVSTSTHFIIAHFFPKKRPTVFYFGAWNLKNPAFTILSRQRTQSGLHEGYKEPRGFAKNLGVPGITIWNPFAQTIAPAASAVQNSGLVSYILCGWWTAIMPLARRPPLDKYVQ